MKFKELPNHLKNIIKKRRKTTGRKFGLSGKHLKRWIKAKLQINENPTFFKKSILGSLIKFIISIK